MKSVYPCAASVERVSFFMREDLAKLDKLDAQTLFLSKHQFSTAEELLTYKAEATKELAALADERANLWNEVKRSKRQGDETAVDQAKIQIAEIRGRMKSLRKEVILCDDILMRSAQTREELAKLLNISMEQMSYITNADAGCGLIKYGSALVPFINRFPQDTKLYQLMTTKPGEGRFALGEE